MSDDPELVELRNYVANLKARGVSRTEALEDAKAFVQKQSWYTASLSLIPKEQRTFKHQRYRNHYAKAMKRVKDALDRLY